MLFEGLDVGQDLAGVALVGKPVDHRHGGGLGEPFHVVVVARADHHRIDHAREHASGVVHRLLAAQLHVLGGGDDAGAAQLAHGRVEGEPRTGGVLLENHGQGPAPRRRVGILLALRPALASGLAPLGVLQDVADRGRVMPPEVDEMPGRAHIPFSHREREGVTRAAARSGPRMQSIRWIDCRKERPRLAGGWGLSVGG